MKTLRVDQVGSLLRPESLKQAFRDHALGALDAGALREAQDQAIREIVDKAAHETPLHKGDDAVLSARKVWR